MSGAAIEDIDYYAVLDVSPEATLAEITRAYRMRSLKVHPDRNPDNPQAAQLFHELRIAADVLTDPTQRASFDALLAARNAKKARFASLDNKRKAMAEDLDRREREFKRSKGEELKERGELERLKEEGRRMREEREKRSKEVLDREKEVERVREEEKERRRRTATNGAVELGPLDTTLKVKWLRSLHPAVIDSDALATVLRARLAPTRVEVDSIVLASKFVANPTKGKYGSGVVALKSLSGAVKIMDASRGWEGFEVNWAAGEPPAVLAASAPAREQEEPAKMSSFPASLLVDSDEAAVLAKLRAKERDRMMEELRRQEAEEG